MASRIIIKIKDDFFLQKKTITENPHKLILGREFFAALNLFKVTNLYKVLKKPKNINESLIIFKDLIKSISGLAINGKIESLFAIIDATIVVNLMQEAKDTTGFKGANLLNYYFIDVEEIHAEEKLVIVNNFILNPKSGVAFAYIEGEISNGSEPITETLTMTKDKSSNINLSSKSQSNLIDNNSLTTKDIILSINSLFNDYFNFDNYPKDLIPEVKVVDFEEGWIFSNSGISNLQLSSSSILGGGYNYGDQNHGTNTLNVLFGTPSGSISSPQLGGLCKNAKPLVASMWSPPIGSSSSVKNISATLAKILGKIPGVTSTLNAGDIVLIELQLLRRTKLSGNPTLAWKLFPVGVEQAIFDTIAYGVGKNIIIIQAAGNGDINLDLNKPNGLVAKELSNFNSGAIMVGALTKSNSGLSKHIQSNSGSRVNSYCFGDSIITSAGTNFSTFSATSLASAVIAALVANMQIVRKMKNKPLLTNADIKTLLGSHGFNIPANGSNFLSTL